MSSDKKKPLRPAPRPTPPPRPIPKNKPSNSPKPGAGQKGAGIPPRRPKK